MYWWFFMKNETTVTDFQNSAPDTVPKIPQNLPNLPNLQNLQNLIICNHCIILPTSRRFAARTTPRSISRKLTWSPCSLNNILTDLWIGEETVFQDEGLHPFVLSFLDRPSEVRNVTRLSLAGDACDACTRIQARQRQLDVIIGLK